MLLHLSDYTRFRPDRHHTELVADFPEGRVAVFSLEPGQRVEGHQAPARVLLSVIEGQGQISVGETVSMAKLGDMVLVDPLVTHGMKADHERFVVLAVIISLSSDDSR